MADEMTKGHYFVVRYMLDELRDEAANVGVILLPAPGEPPRVHFLDDPSLRGRRDASIDTDIVAGFRRWLDQYVAERHDRISTTELENALRERTGNVIRIRGPHTVLLTDPDVEERALFDEWVAPRETSSRQAAVGPRDPLGGLRKEAQKAIAATLRSSYKGPRGRQAIQRDYEVEGKIHLNRFDAALIPKLRGPERLFHHVLVLPNPEDSFDQAAALARRWIDVRQANGKSRHLTAVFYRRGGGKVKPDSEAEALLENDKIKVATLAGLPGMLRGLEPQKSLPLVRSR
jgi:glycine/D-amino acid oxidase-like deaminating enzyme